MYEDCGYPIEIYVLMNLLWQVEVAIKLVIKRKSTTFHWMAK